MFDKGFKLLIFLRLHQTEVARWQGERVDVSQGAQYLYVGRRQSFAQNGLVPITGDTV